MKRCAVAQLGFVMVLVTSSVEGQTPSYNKNLEPLLPLIGNWTGNFTLQQDLGDLAKAGDTIVVMATYDWTKNKKAISLSAAAKIGEEWVYVTDGFIVFDAQRKKIMGVDSYASGGVFRHEAEVTADKLIFRGRGCTGEGVPTEMTVVYSNITPDSFTGQFLNQKEGDKKLPDGKPFTFKRAKD